MNKLPKYHIKIRILTGPTWTKSSEVIELTWARRAKARWRRIVYASHQNPRSKTAVPIEIFHQLSTYTYVHVDKAKKKKYPVSHPLPGHFKPPLVLTFFSPFFPVHRAILWRLLSSHVGQSWETICQMIVVRSTYSARCLFAKISIA